MSSNWSECTLGDVLQLQRGMDLPVQDRKPGNHPIVASTGIVGYHNHAPVRAPGVVIGRSGSIGGGQYLKEDFWPLNTTLWVTDFKGNNPRYCYYLLRSIDFSAFNVGTGVPTLNRNHIHPLRVKLPPLDEQGFIAKLLGDIDDRIELLREENNSMQGIAQAIFRSWFIDFEPVRINDGSFEFENTYSCDLGLFPSTWQDSSLGPIPFGWRVGQLSDLVDLRNERLRPSLETQALPYVPTDAITSKSLFLEDSYDGALAKSSLIAFEGGDILFGAMRPYFHKVCMAPFSGVTRTTVFTLKPKLDSYQAFSLFTLFRDDVVEYATLHSQGSTIPYAKWTGSLERMKIVLPDEKLIETFNDLAMPFINKGNQNNDTISQLKEIKRSLLPKLISGEIKVT